MKNEDQFERHLRCQPLRPVPPAWRGQILAAAEASRRNIAAERVSEDQAALFAGWRLVFARVPLAWASLAALWLVLVGVNLTLPSPMVGVAAQPPASVRLANLAALDLLRAEFDSAHDSFAPAPEAAPARKPSEAPHRPRSERWRSVNFGAADPDFLGDNVA